MSKVCFKLIVLTRVRRRLANVFFFTNKSTDEIWFFRENEAHPRTRADTSEAKWFATSAGPVKRAPPDAQQTGKKPWDCVQVSLAFDDLVTIHLSTGGLWYLTDLMTFMSDFSRWYWCIFSGKADSVGGRSFIFAVADFRWPITSNDLWRTPASLCCCMSSSGSRKKRDRPQGSYQWIGQQAAATGDALQWQTSPAVFISFPVGRFFGFVHFGVVPFCGRQLDVCQTDADTKHTA